MVNKWIQAMLGLLIAAISAIEGYKEFLNGGLSNWKVYAFGVVAIAGFILYFKKRQERNLALKNKNK